MAVNKIELIPEKVALLKSNIQKAFKGEEKIVDLVITTLVAGGHLLIEDRPGVGKTTLAKALARSINGIFSRIQFTSDLLPTDITGTTVFNTETHEFEFKPGPIFANIILADEINRATPKTQSSLLEAMSEYQVTVDKKTYPLKRPFMVIATQNPYEYYGTYPLPESELDRFMIRISIGYPKREQEKSLMKTGEYDPALKLKPILECENIIQLQEIVSSVKVDEAIVEYIMNIVEATRNHPMVKLGASPRGAIMLYRAAQSYALIKGRNFVIPDDIQELLVPVLAHRLVNHENDIISSNKLNEAIIEEIKNEIEVPI